jgi:hypothetical protein
MQEKITMVPFTCSSGWYHWSKIQPRKGTLEEHFMENQLIPFNFEGMQARTIIKNDDTWFVAKDVADALGYSDTQAMTRRLDDDEISTCTDDLSGQVRQISIINESGLYSSILGSTKPIAKSFKKWVRSVVIPDYRRRLIEENRRLLGEKNGLCESLGKTPVWQFLNYAKNIGKFDEKTGLPFFNEVRDFDYPQSRASPDQFLEFLKAYKDKMIGNLILKKNADRWYVDSISS